MAKYTIDLKMRVVQDYRDGKGGYGYLAKFHGIVSPTQVRTWVHAYKNFGIDGLASRKKDKVYTVQFKLSVLEYMKEHESSLYETAHIFGLNNPPLIIALKKHFHNSGIEGLGSTKGRPSMSKKKELKEINYEDNNLEKKNQELKEKIYLLELENLYLKKLKTFLENPEDYLERDKSKSSKNSKK